MQRTTLWFYLIQSLYVRKCSKINNLKTKKSIKYLNTIFNYNNNFIFFIGQAKTLIFCYYSTFFKKQMLMLCLNLQNKNNWFYFQYKIAITHRCDKRIILSVVH